MTTTVINIRNNPTNRQYVYIGRPSLFGNPFTHLPLKNTLAEFQCKTREEAIEKYLDWFIDALHTKKGFRKEVEALKGQTLGCFCKPESCHGDLIATWLDNEDA